MKSQPGKRSDYEAVKAFRHQPERTVPIARVKKRLGLAAKRTAARKKHR